MAILKATVLIRANKICKRAETDIDDILLESMLEISICTGSVADLATGNTVADTAYVSAPTDLAGKLIHSLYINDDKPLDEITWSQYLRNNMAGYCLYKDRIYLRPTPSSSSDVYYCEYSKIDDDVDSIGLDAVFQEPLIRLTAAKLYEKYEMYDKIDYQMTLYERALIRCGAGKEPTAPVCQYNGGEL